MQTANEKLQQAVEAEKADLDAIEQLNNQYQGILVLILNTKSDFLN